MAGILKRLTKDSAAADELAEAINAFLRQDWDPELEGDTIPRYVIALACKITDRKKLKLQLEPILQEYAEDFLEWLYTHLRTNKQHYDALEASAQSLKQSASASPAKHARKAAAPAESLQQADPIQDVGYELREEDLQALEYDDMDELDDDPDQEPAHAEPASSTGRHHAGSTPAAGKRGSIDGGSRQDAHSSAHGKPSKSAKQAASTDISGQHAHHNPPGSSRSQAAAASDSKPKPRLKSQISWNPATKDGPDEPSSRHASNGGAKQQAGSGGKPPLVFNLASAAGGGERPLPATGALAASGPLGASSGRHRSQDRELSPSHRHQGSSADARRDQQARDRERERDRNLDRSREFDRDRERDREREGEEREQFARGERLGRIDPGLRERLGGRVNLGPGREYVRERDHFMPHELPPRRHRSRSRSPPGREPERPGRGHMGPGLAASALRGALGGAGEGARMGMGMGRERGAERFDPRDAMATERDRCMGMGMVQRRSAEPEEVTVASTRHGREAAAGTSSAAAGAATAVEGAKPRGSVLDRLGGGVAKLSVFQRLSGMPATKGASEPARKRAQAGGIEASAGSDDEAGPSSARNRRSSPNAPSAAADIGSPAKLQKASTAAQDKSEGIARQAGRADGSGADSSDGDEEGEVKATKEKGTSSKEMTEMKQQLLAIKAELEKTKQAAAVAQNAANPAAAAAQMPSAGPAAPSMRTMAGPAALTAASPGHAVNEPASCSVLVNKIPVGISKEQIIAHFQMAGSVKSILLFRDKASGVPSGKVKLEFTTPEAAQAATAFDGCEFFGGYLQVSLARPARGAAGPPAAAAADASGGAEMEMLAAVLGLPASAMSAALGMAGMPGLFPGDLSGAQAGLAGGMPGLMHPGAPGMGMGGRGSRPMGVVPGGGRGGGPGRYGPSSGPYGRGFTGGGGGGRGLPGPTGRGQPAATGPGAAAAPAAATAAEKPTGILGHAPPLGTGPVGAPRPAFKAPGSNVWRRQEPTAAAAEKS